MRIKVLMIVPNLRVANGVASYAINYFRLLDKNQIQMDFAVYADIASPYYEEIKERGGKYYVLPSIKKPIEHIRACNKILNEGRYDIIHDNTLLLSIPIMMRAKKYGVPVRILHSHSAGIGETPRKARRNDFFLPLLKTLATDYAACSDAAAKAMFGDAEFRFVPNIVSENRLVYSPEKRALIRKKMGVSNKLIIGTVGRMSPPKNPYFALDIVKEIVKNRHDVEYWWIGSGAMDDAFRKKISDMELDEYVHFFGNREDVSDLYQAMDVFLLPSLFEGMPVTGIEAQTMGLPCVISDNVTKELRFTELLHYISLKKTKEEWAKTIIELLCADNERRPHIQELRKSPFSEREAGKNLESIYETLIINSGK